MSGRSPYLTRDQLDKFGRMERRIQAATVREAIARRQLQARADSGHLYVIQFPTGALKVGKTASPLRRLRDHAEAAKVYGVEIANTWISPRHDGHSKTERQLIKFCADRGRLVRGKEYFADLGFEFVREYAEMTVTLSQAEASFAALAEACDGDESMTVAEAWRRATVDAGSDPL